MTHQPIGGCLPEIPSPSRGERRRTIDGGIDEVTTVRDRNNADRIRICFLDGADRNYRTRKTGGEPDKRTLVAESGAHGSTERTSEGRRRESKARSLRAYRKSQSRIRRRPPPPPPRRPRRQNNQRGDRDGARTPLLLRTVCRRGARGDSGSAVQYCEPRRPYVPRGADLVAAFLRSSSAFMPSTERGALSLWPKGAASFAGTRKLPKSRHYHHHTGPFSAFLLDQQRSLLPVVFLPTFVPVPARPGSTACLKERARGLARRLEM